MSLNSQSKQRIRGHLLLIYDYLFFKIFIVVMTFDVNTSVLKLATAFIVLSCILYWHGQFLNTYINKNVSSNISFFPTLLLTPVLIF